MSVLARGSLSLPTPVSYTLSHCGSILSQSVFEGDEDIIIEELDYGR